METLPPTEVDRIPHVVVFESSDFRRTLEFDSASGLRTTHFVIAATGTDLIARAGTRAAWTPEFSFRLNDEPLSSLSPDWALIAEARAGTELTLRLRHTRLPVEVEVIYGTGPRRSDKRIVVVPRGGALVTLTHVTIEHLPAELGAPGDLQLRAHYASLPRETYITGRIDDAAILLSNPRSGEGVVALNETPGHLKRVETGAWFWEGALRLMCDTDLFPLEVTLRPDERWASPRVSLVFTRAEAGFADPRWAMPAATADVVRKPSAAPAWHYNTWVTCGPRPDADTVAALIPLAARMGFDIFTIDDGWQAAYGENAVDAERFPRGLEPLLTAVEAQGMRLGLWAPLAVVDPTVAAASTALQCRDAAGRPKTTTTAQGEQIVMCLASTYRHAATERLNALISRYRLAYLKLDLTTLFNAYGEAPGCHAVGHDHATAAESIAAIYAAIADITAGVYAAHPDVLIDLTFELWGHKHVIDYGLLRAADLDWLSNVGDDTDDAAGPRQARTLLYQRALAIPVEAMLIGNLQADTGDPAEKFATALGSCPLLLGDLRRLAPSQIDDYGRWIRAAKALRRVVPLNESFFPLGSWQAVSVLAWDGFARLSRAGEGLIVLFRNASTATAARVRVPLPGEARYSLTSVLDDRPIGVCTAADFRAGFDLSFGDRSVNVIAVRLLSD